MRDVKDLFFEAMELNSYLGDSRYDNLDLEELWSDLVVKRNILAKLRYMFLEEVEKCRLDK